MGGLEQLTELHGQPFGTLELTPLFPSLLPGVQLAGAVDGGILHGHTYQLQARGSQAQVSQA